MKTIYLPLLAALLAPLAQAAGPVRPGEAYCGQLANAYGPFDYRITKGGELNLVERAHFTEAVERGEAGNTGTLGGDLDYTLRAFPNHARALTTLLTLARRQGNKPVHGLQRPMECYFERAVRFQPEDSAAWMLYAQFLYLKGQSERALPMLETAHQLEPDNATVAYNLGLAYARQNNYTAALPLAQQAYRAGFPLPGLKQMLQHAGHWQEPEPAPAEPAAEAAPPAQP